MPTLENAEVLQKLIQILIKVIGRRTTKNFAITTVGSNIKALKQKYDFIKYVELSDAMFSEKSDDVKVKSEINNIQVSDLGPAIDDLFDNIVHSLGRNVGFFYIKEIQQDLEKELGALFNEFEINLNLKQQEHLIEIMENKVIEIQEIKNTEVFEIILNAIVKLINIKISENFTKDHVIKAIKTLQEKENYAFLGFLEIEEIRDPRNPYQAYVDPEIDNFLIAGRGEVIQKLLEEIGKSSDLEVRKYIGSKFGMLLDDQELRTIKKIGLKLEQLDDSLRKEGHQALLSEIFQATISIIEKKISGEFGINYIDAMLKKVQVKHEILKYIKVDNARLSEGINAIVIDSKINSVDSYTLGKAVKDILGQSQIDLKNVSNSFITDFQKQIGKVNLEEMEKIGVNMHMLELRGI